MAMTICESYIVLGDERMGGAIKLHCADRREKHRLHVATFNRQLHVWSDKGKTRRNPREGWNTVLQRLGIT